MKFADGLMMDDAQAGLEDFAYMEGVVDVDQLKEQIVVTGAEVNTRLFFSSTGPICAETYMYMYQNPRGQRYFNKGLQNIGAGWAQKLHLG